MVTVTEFFGRVSLERSVCTNLVGSLDCIRLNMDVFKFVPISGAEKWILYSNTILFTQKIYSKFSSGP